jgi:MYXO-CTERM domain-containing protein
MRLAAPTLCTVVGLLVLGGGGCAFEPGDGDHHESDEPVGATSSELTATDPVSSAVSQSCSTTSVKGLAQQLVDEIQCMRPNTLKRIDAGAGFALGSAVFPYLQTPAANALVAARAARGGTMSINSGLRTLPQQYLLYRWYQTGRCGIGLAAKPGRSNHESALAVDINDNAGWRSAMGSKGFRWLGSSDPVHFDYTGTGAVDLRGLSVKAFQRLWNRNHPTDRIAEDGDYGPMTEARLAKAPVGGFAKGATCTSLGPSDPGSTPEEAPPLGEVPVEPDATEPSSEPAPSPTPSPAPAPIPDAPQSTGCQAAPAGAPSGALAALGVGLAIAVARRRRRGAAARA